MNYSSYILFIPLMPLLAFVLLGLFGKKQFTKASGLVATAFMLISTVVALYTAWDYFFVHGKTGSGYQPITVFKYTWLVFSEKVSIDMGLLLDPISAMMLVVVTFVSLMVHIFSLGYMKGEERFATYFAFLGLFTLSMLGWVLASNLFQVYIC